MLMKEYMNKIHMGRVSGFTYCVGPQGQTDTHAHTHRYVEINREMASGTHLRLPSHNKHPENFKGLSC